MRDPLSARNARLVVLGAGLLACALAVPGAAVAQGSQWQTQPAARPPAKQTQPKRQPQAEQPSASASSSDGGLRQRVEQLEEQLVDMQVVIGTLESLARQGGGATTSAAFRGGAPIASSSGADAGRIAALETQVQALTAQLERMSDQLRALQGGGAAPRGPSGPSPRTGAAPSSGGFGTTRVVPANDPIANLINEPGPAGPPPAASAPGSRQQYDVAYRSLMQQDYASAEQGFAEFLRRYPSDPLTPSAQFWLGETHFVRGQWDSAAAAFLKVAQSHPRSDKAPDSLAKFAMAMERKGNKPAACRALQELNARYPNPPAHVKTWEAAERRRAGCT